MMALMHKEDGIANADSQEDIATQSTTEPCADENLTAAMMFAHELERIKSLEPPSLEEIQARLVFLGPQTKRTTLALDLDETLVAARNHPNDGTDSTVELLIRPYARQLLMRLAPTYEIVIFTAAEELYASQIVGQLDPKHMHVKRLLTRSSCIPVSEDWLVKDLRIFADRDPNRMLIVDNSILSFAF